MEEFFEDKGRADTEEPSGTLGKERSMSMVLSEVWGFLLGTVVWCTCPLRRPGTK